MEPNFDAFQLIGQIALGIIGFSAILIGLSRTSDGFSDPDNFRIQLLTYSAFGAMFGSIIPFAIFVRCKMFSSDDQGAARDVRSPCDDAND